MKFGYILMGIVISMITSLPVHAQTDAIEIVKNDDGFRLVVNDKSLLIKGMNWDYYPIGTNYSYNLFDQPDKVIEAALKSEMTMLRDMGVNCIRHYTGIPPRWVTYIYRNYGIYTMINHPLGRYGVSMDDQWISNVDYADEAIRKQLLEEVRKVATEFKDTPGLLLYLLGNENNYGLEWGGPATENIPEIRAGESSVKALYSLFNEASLVIKSVDSYRPVALCNGGIQHLEIIKSECRHIDIFGSNVYRGMSFGDFYTQVQEYLDMPVILTEFGADAFDATLNEEQQREQAKYLLSNWKEIYQNAAGQSGSGNSIGGFTFQFSDGWWKHGQDKNLEIHDVEASWENGGYKFDYIKGKHNMNEEWFGICAKELPDKNGLYKLTPRESYYVLKKVHLFSPYDDGMTSGSLNALFEAIQWKFNKAANLSSSNGK